MLAENTPARANGLRRRKTWRSRQYGLYCVSPAECPSCRRSSRPSLHHQVDRYEVRSTRDKARPKHTHHDSFAGHLRAEDQYRFILQHRRIFAEAFIAKVVLPMEWVRRDDNQIRTLYPAVLFVEVPIAGIHACNATVRLLEQLLNTRHGSARRESGRCFSTFVFVGPVFAIWKTRDSARSSRLRSPLRPL